MNEPGLVWMELQSELGETLGELVEDEVGVLSFTKDQDEIIRITDQVSLGCEPLSASITQPPPLRVRFFQRAWLAWRAERPGRKP